MSASYARIAAISTALLALVPTSAWLTVQASNEPVSGLTLDSLPLQGGDTLGPELEQRAAAWDGASVEVVLGSARTRSTRAALGAHRDPRAALASLRNVARSGNPLRDLRELWQAHAGAVDVRWVPTLDHEAARSFLEREQERIERPPVAGLTDGKGWTLPGETGQTLDIELSMDTVARALRAGSTVVDLPITTLDAPPPLLMGQPDGAALDEPAPQPLVPTGGARPMHAQDFREPRAWLPDVAACWDVPRPHCNGPRMVPAPYGEDAANAGRMGLGLAAMGVLLRSPARPEWIDAAAETGKASVPTFPVVGGSFVRGFGFTRTGALHEVSHNGVDIAAPPGTQIRAVDGGLVVYADNRVRGYGNVLMLLHADGATSLHAHCKRILVFAGQRVQRSQVVAEVGSTGLSTGSHLHFEYRRDGGLVDPLPLFADLPAGLQQRPPVVSAVATKAARHDFSKP